jgi:hypothetical protein
MLVLYLALGIAALIWGAVLLRYLGLIGGCLATILLACCFGPDFYSFRAGPLPLTSDRAALLLLAGVYALGRLQGWIQVPRVDRVDLLFLLFLGCLGVSTLAHDWRFREAQPISRFVFLYFLPACVYWIARGADLSESRVRLIHICLGLFAMYLAVTAVAETRQMSALVFPRYILTSEYQEWLGRGRGPFLNPATNGMYLAAGLFAWALFWPVASRRGKLLLLGLVGIAFVGIYCTLTRSCWLGSVLGLTVLVVAALPRQVRLPFVLGCAILASVMLAIKGSSLSSFKRDKNVSEYHMAQSVQLRPMLAVVAVKIAWDHPLFGCGFGQYKKVDKDYVDDRNVNMPLRIAADYVQHNVFLSLLAETGVVGCGLYIALLGGWLHRAWRLWREQRLPLAQRQHGLLFIAFTANWVVNGLFHDTNLMMNANLLAYFLAGVSQGLYAHSRESAATASQPTQSACHPSLPATESGTPSRGGRPLVANWY